MEEERARERGGFLRGGIWRGFNKSGTLMSAGNARRGTKWLWDSNSYAERNKRIQQRAGGTEDFCSLVLPLHQVSFASF